MKEILPFVVYPVIVSLLLGLLAEKVEAQTPVLFLVDCSASMNTMTAGMSRMKALRASLKVALESFPTQRQVAVRAFGHRYSQKNKKRSCADTELLIPFGKSEQLTASDVSKRLHPRGYTGLAHALKKSAYDFSEQAKRRVIILLSDGARPMFQVRTVSSVTRIIRLSIH